MSPARHDLRVAGLGTNDVPDAVFSANDSRERRILISNGCVLTMDPAIGDFVNGDVLIEGSEIRAVGAHGTLVEEGAAGVTVLDATGSIVTPGFVDTHRHMWQGQLRRMVPNVDLSGYLGLRNAFAVQYRPEDSYAGTLTNSLGAIHAGVTTVLDLSHNTRSSAHADAGVDALVSAGIRAVFAYAPPEAGEWDEHWPDDLGRLKGERIDGLELITLRMAQRCFSDVDNLTPDRIAVARELGIGVTSDPVAWDEGSERILALDGEGLLGPDLAFVHCADLSEEAWRAMGEAGVKVSLSPFVDELLGFDTHAELLPTVQRALDVGIRPGLSVDIETTVPAEMFSQMRAVLAVQRMRAALGNPAANRPQLTARDALSFATVHGAETVGLADVTGSLTPGKQADVIVIDQTGPESFPLNNAYGAVVMGADPGSIKAVLIGGRIKKWGSALVDTDLASAHDLLAASRDYLLERVGYEVDLFVDYPTLDTGPPRLRP